MLSYDKKEIKFSGCPGCAYYNHEFSLSCGMAYQNDNFTISQDWELPIKGMMVVCPKKHVNYFSELSNEKRNELFSLVNETMKILKQNGIAENFVFTFEERSHVHFHVCIIPKLAWMKDITNDIAGDLKKIIEYAKQTFITEKDFAEIKEISEIVENGFKEKNK